MKKFMMSVPDEMYKELEKERQIRRLDSIQETLRQFISEYLRNQNGKNSKIRPL